MKEFNVAVVGATGLVGRKILEILDERNFPIKNLRALASEKSAGNKIKFRGEDITVEKLDENSFSNKDIDLALFSAGGAVSEKYIPIAIKNGVKCVDNSSFFRMHNDVILVVPEINKDKITKDTMLIANPNCSTIQSVLALKPIFDNFNIKRIVYNTYQAVSGGGERALEDLYNKTNYKWKYKIFNNVLPQIDDFTENGYTKEEMKMINETRKILGDDSLKITATTARVPVENSHAISINIEIDKDFDLDYIKKILENQEGVKVVDDIENELYPLPTEATGYDDVFVGRIRRDYSLEYGLNLWCVADNIRKGAATNAVENAELLMEV
ncbi:aspartate-semialdehyde dehydrogenase [Anaerococcus porci]|uniref:aspartate-semialdehyde dehydrogenase n=1 Tax=Anaerococcus porci TaxID=2652269 RepID=UPI002A75C710|nr:aspartate-semialdehyde dehydrogenase [Anaerococcus porci]MDY3006239.1 aspartate-semialdehyde dehydrogenase [Anaerococcus porci]